MVGMSSMIHKESPTSLLVKSDNHKLIGKNYDGRSLVEILVKGNTNGIFFSVFDLSKIF